MLSDIIVGVVVGTLSFFIIKVLEKIIKYIIDFIKKRD